MKCVALFAAAALALSPVAAAPTLAQTPNQTPAAAGPVAPTADSQKADAAFRTTWASLVAGTPDYSTMETPLADAVKAQLGGMKTLSDQIGAIKAIEFLGTGPAGVEMFRVTYERATLNAGVRFDSIGKIDTLWIKPAS